MISGRYLVRRLLQAAVAVAGIVLVTFGLIHLAPGDAVDALAPGGADEEYYASLRSLLDLDEPLSQQLLTYTVNVFRGELGRSFVQARPVTEVIGERLWPTLLLMGTSLVLSSFVGVALAALAARKPFGRFDLGVSTVALIGYAVPAFWLGQVAILTVALRTGWFPLQGLTDARAQYTGWAHTLDVIHHLALPALVLAVSEVALITRVARTGLLQELGRDYVRTARAKGAPESRVLIRHALPNALLPVVTIVGSRIGFLFSGAVLVETVFGWPGLGRLLPTAAEQRDHPILLGMVLLVTFSVVVANLLTDFVYAYIDPRIRYR